MGKSRTFGLAQDQGLVDLFLLVALPSRGCVYARHYAHSFRSHLLSVILMSAPRGWVSMPIVHGLSLIYRDVQPLFRTGQNALSRSFNGILFESRLYIVPLCRRMFSFCASNRVHMLTTFFTTREASSGDTFLDYTENVFIGFANNCAYKRWDLTNISLHKNVSKVSERRNKNQTEGRHFKQSETGSRNECF